MADRALYYIDCRVRETRMHFYRRFREPRLFRFARNYDYQAITERCEKYPRAAAKEARFRHEYAPQQTPLHLVLEPLYLQGGHVDELDTDTEAMDVLVEQRHLAAKALLKANPDGALVTCCFQTTPLMMVCLDTYPSMKDVNMLLAIPKSAAKVDMEKRTALHYACCNNRNNFAMIEALVAAYPQGARQSDVQGRLPLHYACMAGPVVNESSSDVEPSSNSEYTSFKNIVVKESGGKFSSKAVVDLLIRTHKDALSAVDNQGETPLHCMCHYLSALEDPSVSDADDWAGILELLVDNYPAAANLADERGCIPVQVVKGLHEHCPAEQAAHKVLGRILEMIQR